MNKYQYPLSKASKFGWPGIRGYAFNSRENFSRASAALIEVTKRHGLVRSTVSDRIYLVLSGKGKFVIGKTTLSAKKDDVIIVPKNTNYDYSGRMKLFLVHSPAYDPANDVDIENLQRIKKKQKSL